MVFKKTTLVRSKSKAVYDAITSLVGGASSNLTSQLLYFSKVNWRSVAGNGEYYNDYDPDHLGSLAVVTDASGNMVQKCAFDAWGYRLFVAKDRSLIFDRGYTGHEHLDEFSLINMNGRMYDPMVGRFLSPDPYVQDPEYSQSFNRYSYCLNNPLMYTDPSGEVAWLIPAIKIGVMMYMAGAQTNFWYATQNGGNPMNPGDWNWKSPWTYVSMASAGYGTFMELGGLNAFKGISDAANTTAAATSYPTPFLQEVADIGRQELPRFDSWISDKYNLLAGPGTLRVDKQGGLYDYIREVTIWGRQSRHAQIMSMPIVKHMHAGQISFLYGKEAMFLYSFIPIGGAVTKVLSGVSKVAKPITQVVSKAGGRLGNATTRSQIDHIATALESRGYKITGGGGRTTEEFLRPLGGGRKGGSYLDITATHPNYPTL